MVIDHTNLSIIITPNIFMMKEVLSIYCWYKVWCQICGIVTILFQWHNSQNFLTKTPGEGISFGRKVLSLFTTCPETSRIYFMPLFSCLFLSKHIINTLCVAVEFNLSLSLSLKDVTRVIILQDALIACYLSCRGKPLADQAASHPRASSDWPVSLPRGGMMEREPLQIREEAALTAASRT